MDFPWIFWGRRAFQGVKHPLRPAETQRSDVDLKISREFPRLCGLFPCDKDMTGKTLGTNIIASGYGIGNAAPWSSVSSLKWLRNDRKGGKISKNS